MKEGYKTSRRCLLIKYYLTKFSIFLLFLGKEDAISKKENIFIKCQCCKMIAISVSPFFFTNHKFSFLGYINMIIL